MVTPLPATAQRRALFWDWRRARLGSVASRTFSAVPVSRRGPGLARVTSPPPAVSAFAPGGLTPASAAPPPAAPERASFRTRIAARPGAVSPSAVRADSAGSRPAPRGPRGRSVTSPARVCVPMTARRYSWSTLCSFSLYIQVVRPFWKVFLSYISKVFFFLFCASASPCCFRGSIYVFVAHLFSWPACLPSPGCSPIPRPARPSALRP